MRLSEESQFFIQNWNLIEKLLKSEKDFRKELSEYFYSVKVVLQEKEWWNGDIVFVSSSKDQFFISNTKWQKDGIYRIWLGVENLNVENVLGDGTPATCYLWVRDGEGNIINDLKLLFMDGDYKSHISNKGKYVLDKYLTKYLPEEIGRILDGEPLNEIVHFIEDVYLRIKEYTIVDQPGGIPD